MFKTRIVTAMPVRRFLDLGMMGDNFGQDCRRNYFANDGYIDIGLGIPSRNVRFHYYQLYPNPAPPGTGSTCAEHYLR